MVSVGNLKSDGKLESEVEVAVEVDNRCKVHVCGRAVKKGIQCEGDGFTRNVVDCLVMNSRSCLLGS